MNILRSYLGLSVTIGTISTVLSAAVALTLAPALIANIGMEKYGIWAFLISLSSLSTIIDVGISRAVAYYVARAHNRSKAGGAFWTGLIILVTLALLILSATALHKMGLQHPKSTSSEQQKLSSTLIFTFAPIILSLALLINFFRAFLEARMKIHVAQIISLIFNSLNYGSALIASAYTQDISTLLLICCYTHLIILLIYILASIREKLPAWQRPSWRIATVILGRSRGYLILSFANLIALPLNRAIIVHYGGPTAHAVFDLGLKVAMAATNLLQTFNTPLFSLFVKLNRKEPSSIYPLVARMTKISALIYLTGMLILFLASEKIAILLTSENSELLEIVLLILVGGVAFTGVAEPGMRAHWATGNERTSGFIRMGALTCNIALTPLAQNFEPAIIISAAYGGSLFIGSALQIGIMLTPKATPRSRQY